MFTHPGNEWRTARVEIFGPVVTAIPWTARCDDAAFEDALSAMVATLVEQAPRRCGRQSSQGLLIDVEHPNAGQVQLPGPPIRLEHPDGTSAARQTHRAPPLLGQHDEAVRSWLAERPS